MKTKTTFVLGAGASAPLGFPLGPELGKQIANRLGSADVEKALKGLNVDPTLRNQFRDAIIHGRFETIDELLHKKRKFRELGNYAIAATILPGEKRGVILGTTDWYSTLFDKLQLWEMDPNDPPVKFVTLNYERSLELYLECTINNRLDDDQENAARLVLDNIDIIHAHGTFGTLLEVPYGQEIRDGEFLRRAAANLAIVTDSLSESKNFIDAKKAIAWAERVVFIGLGYHSVTMKGLFDGIDKDQKSYYGTARGLSDLRMQQVMEFFSERISLHDQKASDFINTEELWQ